MSILRDILLWLWHLLPANPILVRVVSTGSKRLRHLWARLIYLATLFVVLLVMGGGLLKVGQTASLAELAKSSTQTFMAVSLVQLFLMCFIAPVFCAAAITQEKDSNTFHILLTTPLTNGQIVLGALFSRIYFVWVLLLAGLPIFCITMIYGGVTTSEIFQSFGLAACTGLVTGSVAITISFLRIGTRRTIFAFFAGVAVYLLGVLSAGLTRYGQLTEAPLGTDFLGTGVQRHMSWLAPIHPFLSLFVVTGQTPAPDPADVYHYGWPWRWLLAYPQYGYMFIMTLASALMIIVSLIFVRVGSREGERTIVSRIRELLTRRQGGELRRRPRRVWSNPIAWREAATRASAGGQSLLRWVFIIGGIVLGVILLIAHYGSWAPLSVAAPATTRAWLTAITWIELAVILLVVTNTAATTLTREKESQTIELLLSTPLTSQYIIAGMLRGLVSFAVPLIAVPTFTLLAFVGTQLLSAGRCPEVVPPEACLLTPLLMVAYTAMAAMIGLQFSLVSRKTVQAVMLSTVVVMGAAGLLWVCGLTMIVSAGAVPASVVLPFTPFPAMQALIDYESAFNHDGQASQAVVASARITRVFFSVISAAVYLGITYSLYKNMVRGFDMTVRRQSA